MVSYVINVGVFLRHSVACSYASATRSGEPSSYSYPRKLNPRGIPSTKPQGTTTCGCPVRLVVVNSP
jgi:hypothetical protein